MSTEPDNPDRPRKMGYQIRTSVALAVREAVREGAAESQNAFVERALINELKARRRQKLYQAYAEAAADSAFRAEQAGTAEDWDVSAGDGLQKGG
jgi:hypothetical protein